MSDSREEATVDQIPDPDAILPISPKEQHALDLYDKIQELRLEIAIIKAQQSIQDEDADEDMTSEEADTARKELLDARAIYQLRNQVIERVVSADPILKAVHNSTEASPIERDLLPIIQKRDTTALSVGASSTSIADLRSQSTNIQTSTLGITRENVALAVQVMDLAAQVDEKKKGYVGDEEAMASLRALEAEMKSSRWTWRVTKGITSGIVAGSGVDWGRDEALCELVLDPEDDLALHLREE